MKPVMPWQRGLQYFTGCVFIPNSTDATGAWDKWTTGAGTITHATVGTAFDTQFKRTIYSNSGGGGTGDQELGPRKSLTGDYQFWLGDKRYCGGFYFSTVFRIETWNSDSGRLFVGLTAGANANCTSNTLQNNSMGMFHKTTDGANILNFVMRDNAGSETTQVVADATHAVGALASGVTLLWEMWNIPNGISPQHAGASALTGLTVNWKLSLFDTSAGSDGLALNRVKKLNWSENNFTTAPTTKMFAPQVQMSNGADTTANHFQIGVANIYCAPWSGEMD